jgi:hypothetical protein
MRRITWFVGGVVAGAAGAGYTRKKVRHATARLTPLNVVRSAGVRVRSQGRHVVGAIREGRAAMHVREDELKARRDARIETLDDRLEPGDQLYVDGRPVDSARVIVLRRRSERRGPATKSRGSERKDKQRGDSSARIPNRRR